MIPNPLDAILKAQTVNQLAGVMEELFKPFYPDYNKNSWSIWMVKYKSFPVAKKCAASMYFRKLEEAR